MGSIRDPIHGFVGYTDREQAVINSEAFQRLRFIGQLATTPWLYPGAKHSRFEHSIGVMHVASRIFNKIWEPLAEITDWGGEKEGLRTVLRLGALLHDVGHPAFSHAFEEVLPHGSHEYYTGRYILEDEELREVFHSGATGVLPEKAAAIALGAKEKKKFFPELLDVETGQLQFLNTILTSDLLGADRMDYLLRDSHHAGVTYGHFDLERVLDTITVVIDESGAPQLAIEKGGLEAAEGLILARYYMSTQVYYHHVRQILDEWIRKATVSVFENRGAEFEEIGSHRTLTDDVAQVDIRDQWLEGNCAEGGVFFRREHPRLAYSVPNEIIERFKRPDRLKRLERSLRRFMDGHLDKTIDHEVIVTDKASVGAEVRDVPVVEEVAGSERKHAFGAVSRVLAQLPRIQAMYVYAVDGDDRDSVKGVAREWETHPRTLP